MSDAVIDLGELRHGPDGDPLPRPPSARGRRTRSTLLALLVLVGLAASAPTAPREVVTLPAVPGSDALVSDDLFVLVEPLGPAGQRRISATRLPSGEVAWRMPLPTEGRYWSVAQQGETLLATGHEVGADQREMLTIALDRRTGAYRWQQPGNAAALRDGNLLLWSAGDDGGVVRAVDSCCGTVRWQMAVAPGVDLTFRDGEHGVDRLVLSHRNGPTEVRDAVSGIVLARADLRSPDGGGTVSVQTLGDLLLIVGGRTPMITAYGLDDLRQRWRVPSGDAMYAGDCGVVICMHTRSDRVRTIDVATGAPRWEGDRWGWVWPYGGRLLATSAGSGGSGTEDIVVLDPPTGRVLAELGRWELAYHAFGGPLIGVRRHPGGGLLVARLDVDEGVARTVDVLPEAGGECQILDVRLLCRRRDANFGLWRLPN
ncbi:PQQ-binding-like beta-propeller repeat protein [Micromonospora sp. NPDC005979]|uniref:outer membrane protein assembly factor BamB family protein n=1 Tax=Micromonospora sp. NPDC005979 TaxID=3156726 RepID=UPI0033A16A8C